MGQAGQAGRAGRAGWADGPAFAISGHFFTGLHFWESRWAPCSSARERNWDESSARQQPDMAGIGDLDTLASVWGERLSAREQLPAAHKEAYANHAKLAAARAEGDAARLLLADAVGNHDYMDALLADVDGRVSNRPTMTTARSNTTTGIFEAGSSRCGANWPARLRSSASLSATTVRHTLRPIVHVTACRTM